MGNTSGKQERAALGGEHNESTVYERRIERAAGTVHDDDAVAKGSGDCLELSLCCRYLCPRVNKGNCTLLKVREGSNGIITTLYVDALGPFKFPVQIRHMRQCVVSFFRAIPSHVVRGSQPSAKYGNLCSNIPVGRLA